MDVKTYVDIIKKRLESDERGIHFFNHHLEVTQFLTYSRIMKKAELIADKLLSLKIKREEPVLLVYDQGIEFVAAFFGCFLAGVIAVPCYPPVNRALKDRLKSVLKDTHPPYVLVDRKTKVLMQLEKVVKGSIFQRVISWFKNEGNPYGFKLINTEKLHRQEHNLKLPDLTPKDIAFIQYTSGSIGNPKGVVITHENLISNIQAFIELTNLKETNRVFSWLPQYHDMGLIGCILGPVFLGSDLFLTSPFTFLKAPHIWMEGMSKFKASHTAAPNFAYDLSVRKMKTFKNPKALELSHIEYMINGAEPIKNTTLENFIEFFQDYGLKPQVIKPSYGLAEGTLMVSFNSSKELPLHSRFDMDQLALNRAVISDNGVHLVSCGNVVKNTEVHIRDTEGNLLAEGVVGEIWISGPSVSQGYWGKEKETGPFPGVNTGDLGFFHQNKLFVTGRSKDLIIKRGKNYYSHDIEHIAEREHPFIRKGRSVAFSIPAQEGEEVVYVFESRVKLSKSELQKIRGSVLTYLGLSLDHIVHVPLETIHKTSSGKLKRQHIKSLYQNQKLKTLIQL